ncbi:hypothetical protein RHECNPAF_17000108 [Rhizobium etli CNPAF512]|nr:hypothetical protein RHECNPAF_17000108 [Rhizobium etli CNPAF512]
MSEAYEIMSEIADDSVVDYCTCGLLFA